MAPGPGPCASRAEPVVVVGSKGRGASRDLGKEDESCVRGHWVQGRERDPWRRICSQVEPPEPCVEPAALGDTLHIHYTVRGLGRSLGGGGASLKHVSLGWDTWQTGSEEKLGLWGR